MREPNTQTSSQSATQSTPQTNSQSTGQNRAGRPPFFTEVVRAEVCAVVAAGCSYRTAAKYVGCTVAAISALADRDPTFARQLNKAVAQRELIPLSHIREASARSWRAAAWLLQHTVGGRYGEPVPTLEEELAAEAADNVDAVLRSVLPTTADVSAYFEESGEPVGEHDATATPQNSASTSDAKFEFDLPGFGKLTSEQPLRTNQQPQPAAGKSTPSATTPTAQLTPSTSPTARTPSAAPAASSALPASAVLSESISPQQVQESLQGVGQLRTDP